MKWYPWQLVIEANYLEASRWRTRKCSNGLGISICAPGAFTTQWFIALTRKNGTTITSTHTTHSHPNPTEDEAKREATRWAKRYIAAHPKETL